MAIHCRAVKNSLRGTIGLLGPPWTRAQESILSLAESIPRNRFLGSINVAIRMNETIRDSPASTDMQIFADLPQKRTCVFQPDILKDPFFQYQCVFDIDILSYL